jgi:hypothetical protein
LWYYRRGKRSFEVGTCCCKIVTQFSPNYFYFPQSFPILLTS